MLRQIIKEKSVTPSEAFLSYLCGKTFLSLWSYPNVYTDEGFSKTNTGKELCDLLVVFNNNIFIFSDKDIKFNHEVEVSVAWERWKRKSIYNSIRQLYGAESFMRRYPSRIYVDRECSIPFPIEFNIETAKVYLISVTKNSLEPASKYFNQHSLGSSGTLVQCYNHLAAMQDKPFHISDYHPEKTFVHIFDERALQLVMSELDTIYDFASYLDAKQEYIRNGIVSCIVGEEEFLALYIANKNPMTSGVDEIPLVEPNSIIVEGHWESYQESFGKELLDAYKKGSEGWDRLINHFSQHILSANVGLGAELEFSTHEKAIKYLASENRVSRYYLNKALSEKFHLVPRNVRSARLATSPLYQNNMYILLFFPKDDEESYEKYREARQNSMHAYAFVAKYKYPKCNNFIVFATEPKGSSFRSEDIIVIEYQEELSLEMRKKARMVMEKDNVLNDMTAVKDDSSKGYDVGRNCACPCGSGKKYKKCCL
ncbi:TPA: SEC-C domain-containing protein [Aeromonas dhakensis]|nr:SEC-C domain-containing protein [Aeromonas dhakensis]